MHLLILFFSKKGKRRKEKVGSTICRTINLISRLRLATLINHGACTGRPEFDESKKAKKKNKKEKEKKDNDMWRHY